jgi:hypothetical protein
MSTPTEPDPSTGTDLLVLIDPGAEADEDGTVAPEHVIGGWEVDADGITGRFVPNAAHVPSDPDVPSDPADAALRGLTTGDTDADDLFTALADIDLLIGHDGDGDVAVVPATDRAPYILAVTAPRHCGPAEATVDPPVAEWRLCTVAELADALPEGIDVLLNPEGPAPAHLTAVAVRDAAGRMRGVAAGADGARGTGSPADPPPS